MTQRSELKAPARRRCTAAFQEKFEQRTRDWRMLNAQIAGGALVALRERTNPLARDPAGRELLKKVLEKCVAEVLTARHPPIIAVRFHPTKKAKVRFEGIRGWHPVPWT